MCDPPFPEGPAPGRAGHSPGPGEGRAGAPFGGRLSPGGRQRPAPHAGCPPLQKGTGVQLGRREWWGCGAQKRGLPPGGHGWATALPTLSPREPRTHHQDQLSGEARPCSILPRKGQAVAGDRSLRLAGEWWPQESLPLPEASASFLLLSPPLPCLCQLSSFLLPAPRPPGRSPSSSPLCFLPPLLPLVSLFTRPTCLLSI